MTARIPFRSTIRISRRVLEFLQGTHAYQSPNDRQIVSDVDRWLMEAIQNAEGDMRKDGSIRAELTTQERNALWNYVHTMRIGAQENLPDPDARGDYLAAKALMQQLEEI
ncbi:hypothetical protein SEA_REDWATTLEHOG_159 [Gordonia phage RedWattleHog]|uniref:Uncharacterized protein n=1 Tax=Gordonia phage Stormageddon TaxID=2656541 RepID=A0A649VR74_9CAUD|nr:hypothetical protein KHQ86_gp140 [Gordonia phage Stormageddon]QGJ95020.1 hypothetical protein SEA_STORMAGEDDON_160 [Gordonia phage Stormageddon]QLF83662.1 hypothetical protein SEA_REDWATTLEHOG_159 [Gordonia phage RedWattleHog]